MVLEKRVPWTARRSIQSVLKEISPELLIVRTDAEAETPILWPPDAKNWIIWKDPDAGKDGRLEEKGMTEDEMVGWHHHQTQRTWVWVNSRSWWWTGRPGVLQSIGLQRVGHNWVTELNWLNVYFSQICDILSHVSSDILSSPFLVSSLSETSIMHMFICLEVAKTLFFHSFFFLFLRPDTLYLQWTYLQVKWFFWLLKPPVDPS